MSPKNKVKYIKIYANSEESKSDLHGDPNVNYKILESEIISSTMNCHMEKDCKIQQKETQRRSLDNFWYLKIS